MSSVPRSAADEQEAGALVGVVDRDRERRGAQCQQWNADSFHQAMAGKARAAQFTPESQAAAGQASFDAFSARWRAAQGTPPLLAEAVRKYVLPAMIRGPLGQPLSPELQEEIWRAWCAGDAFGVEAWFSDDNEPPPNPAGLWAQPQPQPQPPMAEE